mgnify:CR=1 FL=1
MGFFNLEDLELSDKFQFFTSVYTFLHHRINFIVAKIYLRSGLVYLGDHLLVIRYKPYVVRNMEILLQFGKGNVFSIVISCKNMEFARGVISYTTHWLLMSHSKPCGFPVKNCTCSVDLGCCLIWICFCMQGHIRCLLNVLCLG